MARGRGPAVLAAALLAAPAAGATETVRLATLDWPPFYSSELPGGGPVTRVTRQAFAQQNYAVEVTFTNWNRAKHLVEAGRKDFLLGAWVTDERRKRFRFTEPVAYVRDVVVAHRDTGITRHNGLKSLAGFRLGYYRGGGYGDLFAGLRERLTLLPMPNTETMLGQFAKQRIDMFIDSEAAARFAIAASETVALTDVTILEPALRRSALAHAIADDHPRGRMLAAAFNKGLAALRANGRLAELMPPERFVLPREKES